MNKIYSYLSSMRVGIFLLVAIGVTSAIGSSLIPASFYRSFTFQLLLVLLLINMTLCTTNQLRKYFKRSKIKDDRTRFFRRIGILMLHIGMVLILIGGVVNSFDGQSESVSIIEGETLDISSIVPKAHSFKLRVDEFRIEFNEDESPSQYISNVSLIEQGKVISEYSINVNNPLNYGGVKIYQSSFGHLIDLQGESDTGWFEQRILEQGDILPIKDTDKALMAYKYVPNYDPDYGMNSKSLKPDNPRIIYSIYQNGSLLDVGFASFGESLEIEPNTYVTFNGVKPYTGLIIKRDPGLPLAAAGGLMLMVGACLGLILKAKRQGESQ